MDRRAFLRLTSMGTLGLFVTNSMGTTRLLALSSAGGALTPGGIAKWRTPLLIPPQMPRAGLLTERGSLIDYYEICGSPVQSADPACWPSTDHGVGLRTGEGAEPARPDHLPRARR